MSIEIGIQLVILVILLGLSGFFSASETALTSISKLRVRHMVDEGVKGANRIKKLIEHPNKLLGAILVGNNVVNIGASALATSLAISIFGSSGVGIATGVMTLLVLIFGEITPKSLASANAEKVSLKVSGIIGLIVKVLNPIIVVLISITGFVIRLFGGSIDNTQPFVTEEELKTMVDVGHEEGVLDKEESEMIHNVLQFNDSQVDEVMIPRTAIEAIEHTATYDEIIKAFQREQFSRLPVYDGSIDNIIGILHIKDVFFHEHQKAVFDIEQCMRKVYYTYESKRIAELFEEMRKTRHQIAIVTDEYGGTAGIVTVEDLVEEIFGDIGDEYDSDVREIQMIDDSNYIIDGLTKLGTINTAIHTELTSEVSETIGGYVTEKLGRFPKKGEFIEDGMIGFRVLELHRNRIIRLRMTINT